MTKLAVASQAEVSLNVVQYEVWNYYNLLLYYVPLAVNPSGLFLDIHICTKYDIYSVHILMVMHKSDDLMRNVFDGTQFIESHATEFWDKNNDNYQRHGIVVWWNMVHDCISNTHIHGNPHFLLLRNFIQMNVRSEKLKYRVLGQRLNFNVWLDTAQIFPSY